MPNAQENWHRGKYPPSIIEIACTHNLLMGFGFSPVKEIFLPLTDDSIVVMVSQGENEVGIRIGTPEVSKEDIARLWQEFGLEEWNRGGALSEDEKVGFYLKSEAHKNGEATRHRLKNAGFKAPNL